jgi:alkylated DNA repair dioxygenase AlkB
LDVATPKDDVRISVNIFHKVHSTVMSTLMSSIDVAELDSKDYSIIPTRLNITRSGSAWIMIGQLPDSLKAYGRENFEKLFDLHPKERGKVNMGNKSEIRETESPRWHAAYLNTPTWNPSLETSYMFSGIDKAKSPTRIELPEMFRPFYDHMNTLGKYNQVVANWYKDGSDFIAFHSDYSYGTPKDTDVAILSLYSSDEDYRIFSIRAKQNETLPDAVFNRIDIKVHHGSILFMHGDTQEKFRHGVPKMESSSKRVSLTFRYFE